MNKTSLIYQYRTNGQDQAERQTARANHPDTLRLRTASDTRGKKRREPKRNTTLPRRTEQNKMTKKLCPALSKYRTGGTTNDAINRPARPPH